MNTQDRDTLSIRCFGQGQDVLVLSGLGMRSWQWLAFLLPFSKRYRFIIPDWRGFGGSKHCQVGQHDTITQHWQDLEQLCQQFKLQDVKVIAYSMGATIAMYGMQYHHFASKINAYLHIDQSPCIRNQVDWPYGLYAEHQADFLQLLQNLRDCLKNYSHLSQLTQYEQQQLLQHWQALLRFQGTHPWLLHTLTHIRRSNILRKFALPMHNLNMMAWYLDTYLQHDLDLRPSLTKLNAPITWISGATSSLYPLQGQQVLAKQLGAQHVIFRHSGHAPLLTEPKRFYHTLVNFLA